MKEKEKQFIPDAEVEKLAKHVTDFKGTPWSESEFICFRTTVRSQLFECGATPNQLTKFDVIINRAPISGGSFNPRSDD